MQHDATLSYIERVRDLGFAIGLHTNGFYPEMLKRAAEYVDWIGLDYKATKSKYEQLTGNSIAYDNMIASLNFWLSTGKDMEVRITCDPRFITKSDLMDIARDLHTRGVKKIAIQKYIPHFEDASHHTTDAERNQFFTDTELRNEIDSMFESVIWRE